MIQEKILILDFGSQYTQLIARRIRENNVYSVIEPHNNSIQKIEEHKPNGIILSGGPASTYTTDAPQCDKEIFSINIPILGICYGMQIGCQLLGSEVTSSTKKEYGKTDCKVNDHSNLFDSVNDNITVWMSHGDQITKISNQFIPPRFYTKHTIYRDKNTQQSTFTAYNSTLK